jgi:hypothetical protein
VDLTAILDDERGAVVVEIVSKVSAKLLDIELARRHHLCGILVLCQGEEQVLQRGVLMLPLGGQVEGAFECSFEAWGQ